MPRAPPNTLQNVLAGLILPLLSILLLPVSLIAVGLCITQDAIRRRVFRLTSGSGSTAKRSYREERGDGRSGSGSGSGQGEKVGTAGLGRKGCVIISGGRMTKGLTLARAFKRAGWKVIGVEEEGWGEYCPLRFSSSLSAFHLLPPASTSYSAYTSSLIHIARLHSADLFIPVSGVASSVEDSQAADEMYTATNGRCRTFIQDPETMRDLHDKDRFMALVSRLGMRIPQGKMVRSVDAAMAFLEDQGKGEKGGKRRFVLKCMGLDENRGDMTLFPLDEREGGMRRTREVLEGLSSRIGEENPYVFQEFIPGQEWCTHASVIRSRLTSFVAAPSNDMLMTYENSTTSATGRLAEEWTTTFLDKLQNDPIPSSSPSTDGPDPDSDASFNSDSPSTRGLTGHFSFDFILSTTDGRLYPIECNARVHTAVILLPLDGIAACYDDEGGEDDLDPDTAYHRAVLRPLAGTLPRSWIYNDLVMRYVPHSIPSPTILSKIHPSLPACSPSVFGRFKKRPNESPWRIRVDPGLVADDWVPFIVFWHVFWPGLLLKKFWTGKRWTRVNVSTGRIFEA